MSNLQQGRRPNDAPSRSFANRLRGAASLAWHHAKKHTGVGVVCAVAYFDPWDLKQWNLSAFLSVIFKWKLGCRSSSWLWVRLSSAFRRIASRFICCLLPGMSLLILFDYYCPFIDDYRSLAADWVVLLVSVSDLPCPWNFCTLTVLCAMGHPPSVFG